MQEIEGERDFQVMLRSGIETIDDLVDTWVKIGCYRETNRLDRMLCVFQKALTAASKDGLGARLRSELVSLHDHKGMLTVRWKAASSLDLARFVNVAWESMCECCIEHEYGPASDAELFDTLQSIANAKFDGHFTVMKFTGNWRVGFGTVVGAGIKGMSAGKTFADAAQGAIDALSGAVAARGGWPCK